jgi:uncharacterized protein
VTTSPQRDSTLSNTAPDTPPSGLAPALTAETRKFFTAGAQGELMIMRCATCAYYVHPPSPRCPSCLTATTEPVQVSGRGAVASCSINHYAWHPAIAPPYPIAIVDLDEQPGLRLTTRIVGPRALEVQIGSRVRVRFEPLDEVWLPLFELDEHPTGEERTTP